MAYKINRKIYSRVISIAPIIIVGMHRSGTSLVTRLLGQCGVMMGIRQTGNAESLFFQDINRTTLDLLGYGWRCLDLYPSTTSFLHHYEWRHKQIAKAIKSELVRKHLGRRGTIQFRSDPNNFRWGWKDPRNSLTLPFWFKVFPDATIVHVYRDGRDVALSLQIREQKREEDKNYRSQSEKEARFLADLALWEFYIRRIQEGMPLFQKSYSLKFEDLLTNPTDEITKLITVLELPEPTNLSQIVATVDEQRRGRHLQEEFAWIHQLNITSSLLAELGYL